MENAPEEIRRYMRPDGAQSVCIVRLADGLLSFTEEARFWEEPHPAIGEGYYYWSPSSTYAASRFDSLKTAERELVARFPWIADETD